MKIFEETALGGYSSSPGAIYPALRTLRSRQFVLTDAKTETARGDVLRISPTGKAALKDWLSTPIAINRIENPDLPVIMLKFTFWADVLSSKVQIALLSQLSEALSCRIEFLEDTADALVASQAINDRLAIRAGIMQFKAMLDWCDLAHTEISRTEKN